MGDALAVSLATLRGFQPEDFARFHPGGSLGRRLLTRVKDVMHRAEPAVCPIDASFHEVVRAISRGRCGIALIVDDGVLCGVITDGDLRRAFEAHDDIKAVKAHQIMTPSPHVIAAEERFAAAEERMRELNVKSLVVVDERRHPTGILQFFDA
jgi:arabinose-5-phosphate isomerase